MLLLIRVNKLGTTTEQELHHQFLRRKGRRHFIDWANLPGLCRLQRILSQVHVLFAHICVHTSRVLNPLVRGHGAAHHITYSVNDMQLLLRTGYLLPSLFYRATFWHIRFLWINAWSFSANLLGAELAVVPRCRLSGDLDHGLQHHHATSHVLNSLADIATSTATIRPRLLQSMAALVLM